MDREWYIDIYIYIYLNTRSACVPASMPALVFIYESILVYPLFFRLTACCFENIVLFGLKAWRLEE